MVRLIPIPKTVCDKLFNKSLSTVAASLCSLSTNTSNIIVFHIKRDSNIWAMERHCSIAVRDFVITIALNSTHNNTGQIFMIINPFHIVINSLITILENVWSNIKGRLKFFNPPRILFRIESSLEFKYTIVKNYFSTLS